MITTITNPISEITCDFSECATEDEPSNRRFVERLMSSPKGTRLMRVSSTIDDELGEWDLFWFPAKSRSDVIPALLLAEILGIQADHAGKGVEEFLGSWFVFEQLRGWQQWGIIPRSSTSCDAEIYKQSSYRILTVNHYHGWVMVAVENPCARFHRDSGAEIWLTPNEARRLANRQVKGELKGIFWLPAPSGAAYIVTLDLHHDQRGYDMQLPKYAVLALENALLSTADEAEAFEP